MNEIILNIFSNKNKLEETCLESKGKESKERKEGMMKKRKGKKL